MSVPSPPTLAECTTLHVGGPAEQWIVADSESALIDAVTQADAAGVPVLLLGGGSNMLVADAGFPGIVVEIGTRGIVEGDVPGEITVRAGEPWEPLVAHSVGQGWSGIEALSGIPGLAGATPIQNVGAYGQDVGQVVTKVRVLDRSTGTVEVLDQGACAFGYRSSAFKRRPDRWVVLDLTLRLSPAPVGVVRYAELARELGVEVGQTAAVADIRAAVLGLRRRKSMVLDAADPDTRSAGSFFTNPVVTAEVAASVPADCPRYPSDAGTKLSAAWLIEQSGVQPGWTARPGSAARVSRRHTLALVNSANASADDVLELARAIRARVSDRFGIALTAEVRMVNCSL